MANNALAMQDQEMMRDALSSEKQMTGLYNAFANECATTAIRDEMLNLLHDEHAIQADLFMEMQKQRLVSHHPRRGSKSAELQAEVHRHERRRMNRPDRVKRLPTVLPAGA